MNDLGGDGVVHVGEEHLRVAVGGHAAVQHHEGALHCLPPPGMVLLLGRPEEEPEGGGGGAEGGSVPSADCFLGA